MKSTIPVIAFIVVMAAFVAESIMVLGMSSQTKRALAQTDEMADAAKKQADAFKRLESALRENIGIWKGAYCGTSEGKFSAACKPL